MPYIKNKGIESNFKCVLLSMYKKVTGKVFTCIWSFKFMCSVSHLYIFLPVLLHNQNVITFELILIFFVFCFISSSLHLLGALQVINVSMQNEMKLSKKLEGINESGLKVLAALYLICALILIPFIAPNITFLILVCFINKAIYELLLNDSTFNNILFIPMETALKIIIGIRLTGSSESAIWLIFPAIAVHFMVSFLANAIQRKFKGQKLL